MTAGYVYILSNPTMPGLCKVGKTTRSPSSRAAELSSATGVASPFVLVYEQPVTDVDAAESWAHQTMAARGWRHAGNREFFTAPLHEIVAVVFQAASMVPLKTGVQPALDSAGVQPVLDSSDELENWDDYLTEGQKLHLLGMETMTGAGGTLADRKRGFSLMRQAADLGEVGACVFAGSVLLKGACDIPKDLPQAFRYLLAAVEAGDVASHALLAQVFTENGQLNESTKHWQAYFTHTAQQLLDLPEDNPTRVSSARTAGEHGRTYLSLVSRAAVVDEVAPAHFRALAPYIKAVLQDERDSLLNLKTTAAAKAIMNRNIDREMAELVHRCSAASAAHS